MHGFLDYCRNPLQVEIFVKLSLHHIGFLMEQPWSEQRMASMFARIAAGRWDMCKELAYTSGQKIRNYTTSDWIAFGTLPNSGTARAHTESKPSFIRPFSRLSTFFSLSSFLLQKSNCLYHFHPPDQTTCRPIVKLCHRSRLFLHLVTLPFVHLPFNHLLQCFQPRQISWW